MKAVRKKTLVILRRLRKEDIKKYAPKVKFSGKNSYILLCTDITSGFSWIEKSNINTRCPARYKRVISINNTDYYAYSWVYTLLLKKETTLTLPNGTKINLEIGDTVLRFASGAVCFLRNGKRFSLLQDLRNNERVVFG